MGKTLPLQGMQCCREEWVPPGESWLIHSPEDIYYSISRHGGHECSSVYSVYYRFVK